MTRPKRDEVLSREWYKIETDTGRHKSVCMGKDKKFGCSVTERWQDEPASE